MARCFLCGKKRQIGRTSRHKRGVAGKQWLKRAQKTLKIFKPNLHVTRLEKNKQKIKAKVCTKCLRRIKKKNEVIHGWKALSVAIEKVEEKPMMVIEKPFVENEEKKEIKKKSVKKKSALKKSPAKKSA